MSGVFYLLCIYCCMKYIITESQEMSIRKVKFFKEYIEGILSKYEWFNGVKIDVSSYKNKGKVLPFYTVMYDTGGHRWNIEEDDVENKVQTMFDLLFPKDKDGELTAVWDDMFV